jgi:hypothetical protein
MYALAALTLALTAGTSTVMADEKKNDRTEALAAKLGLNEQQKEEIRKVFTDFEAKMEPIESQLWTAHREARAEISKMLTDEQRAKLPEVIRTERTRELQTVAAKLGLNDEQRAQVEITLKSYEKKFGDLTAQGNENGRKEFVELKHEMFAAVWKEINDEQRIRLPQVLRAEFHRFSNSQVRNDHVKAIQAKLGLSDEQKTQIEKLLADCNQKVEKPIAQMTELCQEECTAFEKILTKEQRSTLEEIMKPTGGTNK